MTTSIKPRRRRASVVAAIAAASITMGSLVACSDNGADAHPAAEHAVSASSVALTASAADLYSAMQTLWLQHMEWTYSAIDAFATGAPNFDATAARLIQNQVDIGNAIKPYYGDEAGAALTDLLKVHITDVVDVLKAAKADDKPALDKAMAATYQNADDIADFLAKANSNWSQDDLRKMMKGHIDQTATYATAALQGRYADFIAGYDVAEKHMVEMSDQLSAGIVKAFPDKFKN
ncbi:hypothetical protein [Gordonia aichiensis]|uniref:hypothetical protein n=1 Tax=Gordonia aichiensis TaxID=36820 RepID=UPI003267BCB4